MALQPRLDLRQSQTLVMTPQLQQAIKLLQLSNLELTTFVEQELERNPLLDRDDGAPEPVAAEIPAEERRDSETLVVDRVDGGAREAGLDVEVDNTFDEGSPLEGPGYDPDAYNSEAYNSDAGAWTRADAGGGSFEGDERSFGETLTRAETLRDHLVAQLELDLAEAADRMIGLALIDSLDDAGYLSADLDEVADGLGTGRARVEAVLERLRSFDPAGLFARDLRDCLALQLRDRGRLDPFMERLLDNLDLLAKWDIAGLQAACGVDGEDLSEMIAELRALDPKPAQRFADTEAAPVVPDVLMRPASDGGWIVELNPETLPRVLVNNPYHARIAKAARSKEDRAFITESLQTANWLVKALDQRANTILRVATELVRQQQAFFEQGVQGLRPLILRDIAAAIDMHESTVSRVTSNKYIETPRGIYELKYFFTQAIAGTGGGDTHSAEAVRHRIKTLIDAEPPDKVLSDDALVDLLRRDGIDIARRTVAKYREAMRIPSSVQRRRAKKMAQGV